MKSSMKRSGFGFQTWKFQKTSQKLHFGLTKEDPGLLFHFHILNLFKSRSNLGFDQDSNGHKKSTVYNSTQNKHEITSKSLTFTWRTPG
jgi:hypothetical protein